MRRGVVILRPPEGTVSQQSKICLALSHNGFSVEPRTRFDNLLLVAFERDDGAPDVEPGDILALFRKIADFETKNIELKVLG